MQRQSDVQRSQLWKPRVQYLPWSLEKGQNLPCHVSTPSAACLPGARCMWLQGPFFVRRAKTQRTAEGFIPRANIDFKARIDTTVEEV